MSRKQSLASQGFYAALWLTPTVYLSRDDSLNKPTFHMVMRASRAGLTVPDYHTHTHTYTHTPTHTHIHTYTHAHAHTHTHTYSHTHTYIHVHIYTHTHTHTHTH